MGSCPQRVGASINPRAIHICSESTELDVHQYCCGCHVVNIENPIDAQLAPEHAGFCLGLPTSSAVHGQVLPVRLECLDHGVWSSGGAASMKFSSKKIVGDESERV